MSEQISLPVLFVPDLVVREAHGKLPAAEVSALRVSVSARLPPPRR